MPSPATSPPSTKKLNIRRERFVQALADPSNRTQTEAAIKAGYSPARARHTASNLATNRVIAERLEVELRTRAGLGRSLLSKSHRLADRALARGDSDDVDPLSQVAIAAKGQEIGLRAIEAVPEESQLSITPLHRAQARLQCALTLRRGARYPLRLAEIEASVERMRDEVARLSGLAPHVQMKRIPAPRSSPSKD